MPLRWVMPDELGRPAITSVVRLNDFGKKIGFKKGDVYVSLNGEAISAINFMEAAEKFTKTAKEGDMVTVVVKRKNAEGKEEDVTLSAPAQKINKTEEHLLEFDAAATKEQLTVRNAWLNKQCIN